MNLPRAAFGLAMKIMPAERRSWVDALHAELDYVPEKAALSFAVGALATAVRFRLVEPHFIHGLVRFVLAIAALGWAGGASRLAFQVRPGDGSSPDPILLVEAAIYASGALITAVGGLRASRLLATPVLGVVGVLAVGAVTFGGPNVVFYKALAIEDAGALAFAFLLASWAINYRDRRTATR